MPRKPIVPQDVPLTEDAVLASITAEAEAAEAEAAAKRRELEDLAHIARWKDRVDHGLKHDEEARKRYVDDRKVGRGDTDWLVDTNLVGSIIEILMAFIYAKDPDVSVRPSDAVGVSRLEQMKLVAKTMEVVLSRLLKNARLKKKAKRWLRSAMTVGVGWLKVAMQTKFVPDPIMQSRINDLRENLSRLATLQAESAAGWVADPDLQASEIRQQIAACEAKLEREVAEGAIIDFYTAEDVLVAPECGELENYVEAPWIAFFSYKPKEEAFEYLDWQRDPESIEKLKGATLYVQRDRHGTEQSGTTSPTQLKYIPVASAAGEAEAQFGFVKFIEIWSLRDGRVYTLIEGVADRWARQPYSPRTGQRFYPNFLLAFHYNDSDRHPQSDVFQLKKLQSEYGRTRSNYAEHRRRAVSATLFDSAAISTTDAQKLEGGVTQEFIGIATTNGQPLAGVFVPKPYAPVDMNLYDTRAIAVDMEKVSGAQDAQQGSVAVEKTLGEAEIQNSGFQARTGTRRDEMEDVLTDMVEYLAQLGLQTIDEEFAVKLAGPEAVWPQLTVDEALTLFDVEVKAGSTGKPQKNMDKQTWATLLPLVQGMIDKIGMARMQGAEWAAQPWINLLKETALRLDDRIDVEALLPQPPKPAGIPGVPGAPGADPMAALAGMFGGGGGPAAPAPAPAEA